MTFKKTADTLIEGAHTLERDYYTSNEILTQEYENIFFNHWICGGRESELSEPGQYKIINIGSESIIILKDHKNKIRSYYNLCRHRGTRLCENPNGKFSNSIQCKYHGWAYSLNGNLIGSPHMDKVQNFYKSDFGLHPVPLKLWEGFIFINLSKNPIDFENSFEPIIGKFREWNISDLHIFDKKFYRVKGNWKLVIQNYCECYHCPILHPDLAAIHNYMSGKNDLYEGAFLGGYMEFNKNKKSITESGQLCCPILPNITKENENRVYYYSIFPNMLLSLHPEYVMFHTIWPDGNNQCTVECYWLFTKNVVESTNYKPQEAVDFWDLTNKQDWHISELSQLGIQSRKYFPSPYSGQESLLAAFDEFYKNALK